MFSGMPGRRKDQGLQDWHAEPAPRRAGDSAGLLQAAGRLRGYIPALAALGAAIALHYVSLHTIGPQFAGIFFIYLMALLFAAWCGYGPGVAVVLLVGVGVPFLFKPDFSVRQVDVGGLIMLLGVSLIISRISTSRRRTESQLRKSNVELESQVRSQTARLEEANTALVNQLAEVETLYAKMPVGLCFLDRDQRFVRINEKLASIAGIAPEAHGGHRVAELMPKPLGEVMESLSRRVMERGEAILDEEVRDGAANRDWMIGCSPVKTDDGSVVGLQIMLQDITERKRSEEALKSAAAGIRQSEEQFRTLANTIPQLCWMAGSDGWIFWYNERWYQYTGTTPEQMAGWGWQSVHDPQTLPDVLEQWTNSIATGAPFEMVFPLRGADGTYRTFLTRALPVRDTQGRVVRWLGTNTDIAERKSIEDALQRSNEALRRANEDLAQFAYISAHDLQEPLRTVVTFSQLVERRYRGKLDRQADEFLSLVVDSAKRMSRLISDVLEYSRATSEQERVVETVHLDKVLETTLESLKANVDGTRARIVRSPLPVVEGDAGQLGQVLQNLLSNALKYHRAGVPPEVEIGARRLDGDWIISVRDNGQGFRQEYADRVFGMFKRLHGRDVPGSGIGLAVCKTVVERHGGRVWAESRENHGSTFYFTLPAGRRDGIPQP